MKLKSLYISPLEFESGAVIVSYGLMALLKRKYKNVAFFRPIVSYIPNNDIELITNNFKLDVSQEDCLGLHVQEAKELISNNQINKLYEKLIEKYEKLQESHDFVLIQGVSKESLDMDIDFDINLELAKNFNTHVIGVLNGKNKTSKQIEEDIAIEASTIRKSGCSHFATFVNRVDKEYIKDLKNINTSYLLYCIEEVKELSALTIADVKDKIGAKTIFGSKDDLHKPINNIKIGAMGFDNYIEYIEEKDLIIVPADRSDIIIGSIAAIHSKAVPNISCILLTGNIKLKNKSVNYLEDLTIKYLF